MQEPNKIKLIRTACVISLTALVLAGLALKDISRGEADVNLEWNVVQAALGVMLVFHILNLWLLRRRGGSPSAAAPDVR